MSTQTSPLPTVTAENFVESQFEDKFMCYVQRFGIIAKELARKKSYDINDPIFRMPDANRLVSVSKLVEAEVPDPNDND